MATERIYIDKKTGTWGAAEDIVVMDVNLTPLLLTFFEGASDSEMTDFAKGKSGLIPMPYQNRTGLVASGGV